MPQWGSLQCNIIESRFFKVFSCTQTSMNTFTFGTVCLYTITDNCFTYWPNNVAIDCTDVTLTLHCKRWTSAVENSHAAVNIPAPTPPAALPETTLSHCVTELMQSVTTFSATFKGSLTQAAGGPAALTFSAFRHFELSLAEAEASGGGWRPPAGGAKSGERKEATGQRRPTQWIAVRRRRDEVTRSDVSHGAADDDCRLQVALPWRSDSQSGNK